MKDLNKIVAEYNELAKDSTMVRDPKFNGVYIYKNQAKRDELAKQYNESLPENKRMAILLHKFLCNSNHTDQCPWSYEISGIEHDWTEFAHSRYLKMADKLLDKGVDIKTLAAVLDCIG